MTHPIVQKSRRQRADLLGEVEAYKQRVRYQVAQSDDAINRYFRNRAALAAHSHIIEAFSQADEDAALEHLTQLVDDIQEQPCPDELSRACAAMVPDMLFDLIDETA